MAESGRSMADRTFRFYQLIDFPIFVSLGLVSSITEIPNEFSLEELSVVSFDVLSYGCIPLGTAHFTPHLETAVGGKVFPPIDNWSSFFVFPRNSTSEDEAW